MDLIQVLILAVIQGITEWLPISSSGHLVIAQRYIVREYSDVAPFFDVMLHVGTLLVVLIVFWKDIARMLKASAQLDFKTEEGKLAVFIVVGNIPTALIGFVFQDVFKSFFYNQLAVGIALLGTGSILYVSKYGKNGKQMSYLDAFLIGIAQGIAIIPGVSRSGVTIATGLLSKLKKETAFKFSFLLSIPAVIGAAVIESKDVFLAEIAGSTMVLGVIASMAVGYIALKLLQRLLLKERFHLFAYYCWLLGTAIVAITMIG